MLYRCRVCTLNIDWILYAVPEFDFLIGSICSVQLDAAAVWRSASGTLLKLGSLRNHKHCLQRPRLYVLAWLSEGVTCVGRACKKVWSGASPSHPEKHPCGQAPLESNPNVSMQTRSQGLHVDVQQAQQPNVTLNVEDDGMSTSWLRWIKSEAFILWGQWISVQNAPDQLSSN